MEQYVGLDVSQEQTSVCIVDGDGKTLWQGKCAFHPGGARRDHPHEGARGGADRPGERSLVGLALARAEEGRAACGLPRCPARKGGARPTAEQV